MSRACWGFEFKSKIPNMLLALSGLLCIHETVSSSIDVSLELLRNRNNLWKKHYQSGFKSLNAHN